MEIVSNKSLGGSMSSLSDTWLFIPALSNKNIYFFQKLNKDLFSYSCKKKFHNNDALQKWSSRFRISLVSVKKSIRSCGFIHIY